jgi:hypothetical protein
MFRWSCWLSPRRPSSAILPTPQCPQNNAQGAPSPLIRCSVQEIRRIPNRMAQRQIQPARIIAWSLWRRAHQAAASHAHINVKMQL